MKRLLSGALLALAAALALAAVATALGVRRIEADLPAAGEFLTVNGLRLHYTDQGAGPPVLLVHGASSNLLEFRSSLVPRLSAHHRVLAFDRPGFGYSERDEGAWMDPAAQARALLDACETLGAPRPLLIGHSWAGALVMSALRHEADRIAGGVLLSGVAGHWVGEEDLVERLRDWPAVNAVFAHTLVYPVGAAMLPQALEAVFAPQPVPEGHAARVGAALALRPRSYLHNAEDMNRLSGYLQRESAHYAEITGRLLVIHGTADTLVPFWNHGRRLLPVVPGIEVALLEGVGHAPHHVDPDRVAALIQGFAAQLPARAAARESAPAGPGPGARDLSAERTRTKAAPPRLGPYL